MELTQEHLHKLKTLMESVKRVKAGKSLTKQQENLWLSLDKPKAQSLPIFDSLIQAAALSKVPKHIFQKAKAAGSPGFKWNRVDFGEWLAWYFSQETFIDPKAEKAAVELRREKLKERTDKVTADEAEQRVIPKADAKRALTRYASTIRTKLLALPRRNALPLSLLKEPSEIEQKLNAEVRDLLGEVFRGEWGVVECPNCRKEIKP